MITISPNKVFSDTANNLAEGADKDRKRKATEKADEGANTSGLKKTQLQLAVLIANTMVGFPLKKSMTISPQNSNSS